MSHYPMPPVVPRKGKELFRLLEARSNIIARKELGKTDEEIFQALEKVVKTSKNGEINEALTNEYKAIHFVIAYNDDEALRLLLSRHDIDISCVLPHIGSHLGTSINSDSSDSGRSSLSSNVSVPLSPLAMLYHDERSDTFDEFCKLAPKKKLDEFFDSDAGELLIKAIVQGVRIEYLRSLLEYGLKEYLETNSPKYAQRVFELAKFKEEGFQLVNLYLEFGLDLQVEFNNCNVLHKIVEANNPVMLGFMMKKIFPNRNTNKPYKEQPGYKLLRNVSGQNMSFQDPVTLIFTRKRENIHLSIRMLEYFIEYGYDINKTPSNMKKDIVNLLLSNKANEKDLLLLTVIFDNNFKFKVDFELGALMHFVSVKYIRGLIDEMRNQDRDTCFIIVKNAVEGCFMQTWSFVNNVLESSKYRDVYLFLCKYLHENKYDFNEPLPGATMNMAETFLVYSHDTRDYGVIDKLFSYGAKLNPPAQGEETNFFCSHDATSWCKHATEVALSHLVRTNKPLAGLFIRNFIYNFAQSPYFGSSEWDMYHTSQNTLELCLREAKNLNSRYFDINANIRDEVQNLLEYTYVKYVGQDRSKFIRRIIQCGGKIRKHIAAGYVEFFKLKNLARHTYVKDLKALREVFPVEEMDIFKHVLLEVGNSLLAYRIRRGDISTRDIDILKYCAEQKVDLSKVPLLSLSDVREHHFHPMTKLELISKLNCLEVVLVSLSQQYKRIDSGLCFDRETYEKFFRRFYEANLISMKRKIFRTSASPIVKILLGSVTDYNLKKRIVLDAVKFKIQINLSRCPTGHRHIFSSKPAYVASPVNEDADQEAVEDESEDEDEIDYSIGVCAFCGDYVDTAFSCSYCSFKLCSSCDALYTEDTLSVSDIVDYSIEINNRYNNKAEWFHRKKLYKEALELSSLLTVVTNKAKQKAKTRLIDGFVLTDDVFSMMDSATLKEIGVDQKALAQSSSAQ
eukprot:snap_masked-scaffold_6-processed-gene-10.15-mRNA-1 protein AED:1.00 eAED:1.00 QI:0/-1/0/0/-1/1/1/0/960